jgi:hypothetical protein
MQPVQFRPFPRTYVYGLRIHHGLLGFALAVIGAALAAHDRGDFPWPVHDRAAPPAGALRPVPWRR